MENLNDVAKGAIVAERLYAQYLTNGDPLPGHCDLRDLFRKWDAERSTESEDGEGGIDVLIERDTNGLHGVWLAERGLEWNEDLEHWDGGEGILSIENEKAFLPESIRDKPGGEEGWPVEATLYLKLKGSEDGQGETVDFRAVAKGLYEAFMEVEWSGPGDTCPKCKSTEGRGHNFGCGTGAALTEAEIVARELFGKWDAEILKGSEKGQGETADFRALALELYEALVEVEFVGDEPVAAQTCPRCAAHSGEVHIAGCESGSALGKAEALLNL